MKKYCVLSFVCGAVVMLAFTTLGQSNPSHHVYELRLYHVNEGKIDALKARFGDHTDAIFKRHNMKSIGYWMPEDPPSSQNLFIYILQHPSRQEAEKNWAAFQADPEWQKVKAESEKQGALVDHIDHYFMDPTSYSALKLMLLHYMDPLYFWIAGRDLAWLRACCYVTFLMLVKVWKVET